MANCNPLFLSFHNIISLSPSRRQSLSRSRVALRKKIRDHMRLNMSSETQPLFYGQGSFTMRTIVEPIPISDILPYDLDDGVYFSSSKRERKSVSTYHKWIFDAVAGHTEQSLSDKNTCIRVTSADGHNIDLPIYWLDVDQQAPIPLRAHKGNDWIVSDPKAFVDWFRNKKNEQIIRVIKYGKAWCDYQEQTYGKFPAGFIMTILIMNSFASDDRDDLSFLQTIEKVQTHLASNGFECYRPTPDTTENLFDKYTKDQKEVFLRRLGELVDGGNRAQSNPNQLAACEMWSLHFGPRFSCSDAKDELEKAKEYSAPAVIKSPAKSA